MQKNGASSSQGARPDIEIQHADEVVKAIIPPKLFRSVSAWQIDEAVVREGMPIIAPAVSLGKEKGACTAVGWLVNSQKPLDNGEFACGSYEVAFTSLDAYAATTDGAALRVGSGRKNAHEIATREAR